MQALKIKFGNFKETLTPVKERSLDTPEGRSSIHKSVLVLSPVKTKHNGVEVFSENAEIWAGEASDI